MSEVQQLVAALSLKDSFSGPLGKIRKNIAGFDKDFGGASSRAYKAGQQIGTGIKRGAVIAAGAIGLISTQVLAGLRSLADLEKATAQTNAVIKSTKGAAGQTAASIRTLAEKYEDLNAIIDDKVIQSAENVLLTFTAVRKDAFEPAIAAALDMSTALGTDLQGAVLQIGKALQDPERGITALRRAGVNFSKDQITVIKRLVATGKTAEAQGIILAELNKEFGGSFTAAGKTAAGSIAGIGDAVEDLQKALATALFPTIQKILPKIKAVLADPKFVTTIEGMGKSIAGLFSDENIKQGGQILGTLFDTAKAAAPVVGEAAKATLTLVKAAVSLFTSLPKELQQLAVGAFAINKLTGGLVTNLAGGLISSVLKQLVSGVVNVQGAVVNVAGAGVPGGPVAGKGAGLASRAASLVGKVLIVGMVAEVATLISGPVQELAREIGKQLPLAKERSSVGEALTDWIRTAPWPFGTKGQPDWAGGDPSRVNKIDGLSGGLSPEDRDILNDQRQKLQDIKDADQSTARSVKRTHGTVQQQLRAANRIYRSNLTNAQKIERLKAVQQAIGNRNVNATRQVQQKIAAAQRAQVAAANRTSEAIRRKNLSVELNNTNVVNVRVSSQEIRKKQTTFKKYYSTIS